MNLSNDNVPNPIKLLNEWRDTVFATCLVFAFGFGWVSLSVALTVGFWREIVRCWCWRLRPPMQVCGGTRPPSERTVSLAAGMLADGLLSVNYCHEQNWVLVSVFFSCLMLGTVLAWMSEGLPQLASEFIKSWDWPRKSNDGPSETSKITRLASMTVQTLVPAS